MPVTLEEMIACIDRELGMRAKGKKVAVLGYGAGWSWAGAMLDLGSLECAEVMEVTT